MKQAPSKLHLHECQRVRNTVVCAIVHIPSACLDRKQHLARPRLIDASASRLRQGFAWSGILTERRHLTGLPIMAFRRTAWACILVLDTVYNTQGQLSTCTFDDFGTSVRVLFEFSYLRSGFEQRFQPIACTKHLPSHLHDVHTRTPRELIRIVVCKARRNVAPSSV